MGTPSNVEALSHRKQSNKRYLRWIAHMDSVLMNVPLDQHVVGSHSPNGWKAPTFTVVIIATKKDCNVSITKDNILSRLKT